VDTYEIEGGVRNAIEAARETETVLGGVRIDSGDLEACGAPRSRPTGPGGR